jgi:hypothetical protein
MTPQKTCCNTKTHARRTQNATVPFRQKSVAGIHQTEGNTHITMALLAPFQLFEELEVARDDHNLSGGCFLHGDDYTFVVWSAKAVGSKFTLKIRADASEFRVRFATSSSGSEPSSTGAETEI